MQVKVLSFCVVLIVSDWISNWVVKIFCFRLLNINFVSEPCKGVSCSAHAFCRAEPGGGEAYCVCEEGWTYDPARPAAGCVDVDECGLAGTCGENTLCTNTPGNYVCQCKPGYTGNPQVRCIGRCNSDTYEPRYRYQFPLKKFLS
jgi:hypothetical protein